MAADSSRSDSLFENQEIVLTVPASFDEEARELTVEAARSAGFQKLTLLEEPLAAFYAWISGHRSEAATQLQDRNSMPGLACASGMLSKLLAQQPRSVCSVTPILIACQ